MTAHATSESDIELQWISPPQSDLNGDLCKFQVKYHSTHSQSVSTEFNSRQRTGKVGNLKAWTDYMIYIAAATCGGEGGVGPFAHVSVRTQEGSECFSNLYLMR